MSARVSRALADGAGDVVRSCLDASWQHALDRLARAPVAALIATALDAVGTPAFAAMAEDSYRHSNGFAKISFPRVPGTAARLRLHLWLPGDGREPDSDLHNHRWPFASRVLAGRLHQELYRTDPTPAGDFRQYRHEQTGPDRGYRFSYVGRATTELTDDQVIGTGEVYRLPRQAIHRVWADPDRVAATLVVEYPPRTTMTDVWCRSADKVVGTAQDPPRYGAGAVRRMLVDLLTDLGHE